MDQSNWGHGISMRQRTATARSSVFSRKAHGNEQFILTRKCSVRGFRQRTMGEFRLGEYSLILCAFSPGARGRRRTCPILCNPRFAVLLRYENPVNFSRICAESAPISPYSGSPRPFAASRIEPHPALWYVQGTRSMLSGCFPFRAAGQFSSQPSPFPSPLRRTSPDSATQTLLPRSGCPHPAPLQGLPQGRPTPVQARQAAGPATPGCRFSPSRLPLERGPDAVLFSSPLRARAFRTFHSFGRRRAPGCRAGLRNPASAPRACARSGCLFHRPHGSLAHPLRGQCAQRLEPP